MQANAQAETQAIETGVIFTNIRYGIFVAIMLLSAGTMGIAIHFSVLFPSSFHHEFNTYAIVAPAATLVVLIVMSVMFLPSHSMRSAKANS